MRVWRVCLLFNWLFFVFCLFGCFLPFVYLAVFCLLFIWLFSAFCLFGCFLPFVYLVVFCLLFKRQTIRIFTMGSLKPFLLGCACYPIFYTTPIPKHGASILTNPTNPPPPPTPPADHVEKKTFLLN